MRGPLFRPSDATADARVVVAVDLALLGAAAQLVVHLILILHVVDEPGAQGVLRQERPLIDERADVRVVLLPAVGDAAHDLLVEIAVERLVHLLVRGRVALFGERVRRGLVVADVVEIRIRADLVERAAQEQLVGRHAGQIERARRHQEDLVGRRRQVVFAVAAVLEVRVDRLARLLEVEHRVANLLHLAPERRVEAGRLEQHRANARIDLRLAQVVHDRPDRRRPHAAQVADDVGGRHLREIAADPQHERRVGGHRRARARRARRAARSRRSRRRTRSRGA